ncbi:hypothetical protein chiPu_0024979 [Chiloscyllium punctatum]|uniref:Uncharacterized protein n=1 Tax=Chiloscyllium punctatum TaxID=137246 RepID=A0A401TDY8_CHIPU|nr:hypothetical protein [Chiloscyllium punctatum]
MTSPRRLTAACANGRRPRVLPLAAGCVSQPWRRRRPLTSANQRALRAGLCPTATSAASGSAAPPQTRTPWLGYKRRPPPPVPQSGFGQAVFFPLLPPPPPRDAEVFPHPGEAVSRWL